MSERRWQAQMDVASSRKGGGGSRRMPHVEPRCRIWRFTSEDGHSLPNFYTESRDETSLSFLGSFSGSAHGGGDGIPRLHPAGQRRSLVLSQVGDISPHHQC